MVPVTGKSRDDMPQGMLGVFRSVELDGVATADFSEDSFAFA